MILELKHSYHSKVLLTIFLGLLALGLCIQNLVFYLQPNVSLFVFLAIAPFVFTLDKTQKSFRFGWLSLFFIVAYFFFKLQLLFFLSFASFILLIIESNLGKVNTLGLFIILLISPYSTFIFNVFGFSVRLWLTNIASEILSVVFENASSEGNNILIDNQTYSVDPECMGLTMVGYGYATALLMINSLEQKFKTKFKFYKIIVVLIISTLFIILVNLFRIVIVVLLKSPPETITHEVIGLLSFTLYLIAPLYFLVRILAKSNPPIQRIKLPTRNVNSKMKIVLTILPLALLSYFNFNRNDYRNIQVDNQSSRIDLIGFEKSITKDNVCKFENTETLIYVKPSTHFYGPDHSPTICWRGSGYEFKNIQVIILDGYKIYTSELVKGNDVLQTAWWFDNGKHKTNSQLEWRWNSLLGSEPYRLINITTESKSQLFKEIEIIINKNLFNTNQS